MARTRRQRPELTESWDDVEESLVEEEEDEAWENEEEDQRLARKVPRVDRRSLAESHPHDHRRRAPRLSAEPQLVMPSSPNALNGKPRAQTPRVRMNERSMTSDAGRLNVGSKARGQTPRFRMNERSLTSDAGQFKREPSSLAEQDDEDSPNEAYEGLSRYAALGWTHVLQPVLAYCSDVVGRVLQKCKPLIAYAVFVYLISAVLIFGSGFLTNSINNALSPFCRIPGVTYFFHPSFCPTRTTPEVAGPAEFDKLVQVQSAFDDVLVASSNGVNLPLDMKRSEASIRDLRHVVEYSNLPSRNELVYEFGGFIDTARQASGDLSRFNSRIGRAVDNILSTNRWTLNVMDGVSAEEAGRGSLSRFFHSNLNIFAPFQPVQLSRDLLLDQYLRHTNAVEEQILKLISEAQALLGVLENLDDRLDVIAGIATRDGVVAQTNREEIFAFLWTKLGGNRATVKRLDNQIQLLQDVGNYRRIAWAHVTATIVKLQAIRDNLEDLRERVAAPETVGVEKVPLEVHIQSINLGIERLEQQREASRNVEAEARARILSRAESGDGHLIGDKEL